MVDALEPELFCEPRAALDGGEDGLIFYKKILSDYMPSLKENGFILFEIGYDQSLDITELASTNGSSCEIHRDLSGNPRMAVLKKHMTDR